VIVYLFGYLRHDFFGRVLVTPTEQTVADVAHQLVAWGPTPERGTPFRVTNEAGTELDPAQTVSEAGLGNGDIVHVEHLR
jgi:hypothetical protein